MEIRLNKDQKIRVLNSQDLYKVMQSILLRQNKIRRNREFMWVCGLDNKNDLLYVELLCIGSDNRVIIEVPEIFRIAIYKNATKVVLVHNHPNESRVLPSDSDLQHTERILKAGKLIKVDVIDHLIITETDYFSMAVSGHIEKFNKSKNYEMIADLDTQMQELRKQAETIGEIRGERKNKIAVAIRLLKSGLLPHDEIRKASGLSVKEFDLVLKGELQ